MKYHSVKARGHGVAYKLLSGKNFAVWLAKKMKVDCERISWTLYRQRILCLSVHFVGRLTPDQQMLFRQVIDERMPLRERQDRGVGIGMEFRLSKAEWESTFHPSEIWAAGNWRGEIVFPRGNVEHVPRLQTTGPRRPS